MSGTGTFDVEIAALPPLRELERAWLELQIEARPKFCLSWAWIGTWLKTLPNHVDVRFVTVRASASVVALAFIVPATLTRHLIIRSKTWSLHSTGDPTLDCIFIEHNGVLARAADHGRVLHAVVSALESRTWDEVRLPGVSCEDRDACRGVNRRIREDMQLISRYVDLDALRARGSDHLETLGKNTRARVRRTERDFEARYGPLAMREAETLEEAQQFYDELKDLHQRSWTQRGQDGSFANAHFDTFHRTLIRDCFASGCIQLMKLTSGASTVGLLYNFKLYGEVSMYQSGFDYSLMDAPNRQSPGLLTHALAIQHNLDRGFSRYDFLAGDNQYKQVLADCTEALWWGRIQRDAFKFRFEDIALRCWHAVSSVR